MVTEVETLFIALELTPGWPIGLGLMRWLTPETKNPLQDLENVSVCRASLITLLSSSVRNDVVITSA